MPTKRMRLAESLEDRPPSLTAKRQAGEASRGSWRPVTCVFGVAPERPPPEFGTTRAPPNDPRFVYALSTEHRSVTL